MIDQRPRRDLTEIQRRLRLIQAQNDRVHERLALRIHREQFARDTGHGLCHGELDARCEAGVKR
jgi:hypothetical protein